MEKNQSNRYRMDFGSGCCRASLCAIGLSLFLRMGYYLGLGAIFGCSAGRWLLCFVLPVLLCVLYILAGTLERGLPLLYSIIGCCLHFLLAVEGFFAGSILQGFFGLLFFLFCGALLLAIPLGVVEGPAWPALCTGLYLMLRVLLFDLRGLTWSDWLLELSALAALLALLLLPLAFSRRRPKQKEIKKDADT